MIDGLIEHNLLPNLITTHPPLQLDGNFGISAGIAEMLLQSHAGEIALLPGVDLERWPDGAFSGLKARGGFEVSARWQAGTLHQASIRSLAGEPLTLRSQAPASVILDATGQELPAVMLESGTQRFETTAGSRYELAF